MKKLEAERLKLVESDLSNCIGYVAHALGLIDQEKALLPFDYDQLFANFSKNQALSPLEEAPVGTKALVVSQNPQEGPFFPLHMALVDSDNANKIKHRPGAGTPVMSEALENFMARELAVGKEIFFLS